MRISPRFRPPCLWQVAPPHLLLARPPGLCRGTSSPPRGHGLTTGKPSLPVDRREVCHACVHGLQGFSPLGFGRENPKGRQGRMNQYRRIFWFGALQVAGLMAFRLVMHGIKALIKLRRWIPVLFFFASGPSAIETAVFSKKSQLMGLPQSDGTHTARF